MSSWLSTPRFHKSSINITKINIKDFPLSNYKIVQISDLHLNKKKLWKDDLKDLITKIVDINPDIVLITGDLIDGRCKFTKELLEPLKQLTNIFNCYFVFGNHEFGCFKYNIDYFIKCLEELGIVVLENRSVIVNKDKKSFNLVGLSDYTGVFYDRPPLIKKSFKNVDKSLATIVMIHRAGWIKKIEKYDFNLALAGHNHGGQIYPIGLWIAKYRCKTRYLKGLYKISDNKYAFISKGVGYSRLPIRFFVNSEIDLIIINEK